MRAIILAILAAFATGACPAGAQAPRPSPLQVVEALPGGIGAFQRAGSAFDYESRPGGAGLGASVAYRRRDGAYGLATVYVYDGAVPPRALPPGAASEAVADQLASAARDIAALAAQRRYRVTATAEALPVMAPDGARAMRCQRYALAFDNGELVESHVCLGVVAGRFLKLRMTQNSAPERQDKAVASFGAALVAALEGS